MLSCCWALEACIATFCFFNPVCNSVCPYHSLRSDLIKFSSIENINVDILFHARTMYKTALDVVRKLSTYIISYDLNDYLES